MVDRIIQETGERPDFPFLTDPGHRVIDRYGIFNPDNPRGLPHPTTLVIDRDGIVRWRFTEINYRVRPTNSQIMEALEALPRR